MDMLYIVMDMVWFVFIDVLIKNFEEFFNFYRIVKFKIEDIRVE